ncbi:MAG: DUF721 domain-containing protein [Puniceicoccales bacterium]|jgi:hypothetical protein|nr:DUF721 domain-containing protein [Puniceicoccales bacterium]
MASFPRRVENLIAALRGLPTNGNVGKDLAAKPMGDTMERWLKKNLPEALLRLEERIARRWPEIVGPALAQYCHPRKVIRDDVLLVDVLNSVARHALSLRLAEVLEQLHRMPGCRRIVRIRCCQQ